VVPGGLPAADRIAGLNARAGQGRAAERTPGRMAGSTRGARSSIGDYARQASPHVDRSEAIATECERDLAAVESVVRDHAHEHGLARVHPHRVADDAARLAPE